MFSKWKKSWSLGLVVALCFFIVLGARWVMISEIGNAMPLGDQWQAEGLQLFLPYLDGELTWDDLVAPHNEHRLLFPRLQALALFLVNEQQWNPLLQQAVNAGLAALAAALLIGVVGRLSEGRLTLPAAWIITLAWALPLAWQNIFFGFQAQFYQQILFSVIAIYGLGICRLWSLWWLLGAISLFLLLGAAASGFFPALSVMLGIVLVARAQKEFRLDHGITLGLCFTVVGLAWLTRVQRDGGGKVESVSSFFVSLFKNLSWPWEGPFLLTFWIYLPLALLSGMVAWRFYKGQKQSYLHLFLVMLGSLAVLQLFAMAYARGFGGMGPQPRFIDMHTLGFVVNALCVFVVWESFAHISTFPQRFRRVLGSLWLFLFVVGGVFHMREVIVFHLPERKLQADQQMINVRGYLATRDRAQYLDDKTRLHVPFEAINRFAEILENDRLLTLLPASVAAEIPLQGSGASEAFIPFGGLPEKGPMPEEHRSWWGSYAGRPGVRGQWISQPFELQKSGIEIDLLSPFDGRNLIVRLRDVETGRTSIVPPAKKGEESRWRRVAMKSPGKTVVLEAIDNRPIGWLAFTAPRESAWLSRWMLHLGEAGWLVLFTGLGVACFWGLMGLKLLHVPRGSKTT
ncbi:MAG: hypothetical protein ACFCU3_09430 [Verrucomicrobiales bacterium]